MITSWTRLYHGLEKLCSNWLYVIPGITSVRLHFHLRKMTVSTWMPGIKDFFSGLETNEKRVMIYGLYSFRNVIKMPPSQVAVWCQNRKNKRLILGTTQRFTRAAKPVREQTTWHYECRRPLLWVLYRYRVLDGAKYDDDGNYVLDEDEKMPGFRVYVPKFSTMTMYNTLEVVTRDDNHK